jgi:hypothetical protein
LSHRTNSRGAFHLCYWKFLLLSCFSSWCQVQTWTGQASEGTLSCPGQFLQSPPLVLNEHSAPPVYRIRSCGTQNGGDILYLKPKVRRPTNEYSAEWKGLMLEHKAISEHK